MRKLMNLQGNVVSTPKIYGKAAAVTGASLALYLAACFAIQWVPAFLDEYRKETARLQELKK